MSNLNEIDNLNYNQRLNFQNQNKLEIPELEKPFYNRIRIIKSIFLKQKAKHMNY
jgi:hypothetical protein